MNKIIIAIAFSMISLVPVRAEVVVYTEKCGIGAKADYNLLCQIDSNTLEDYVGEIKSIAVCTSYNNRGGMNTPTIVHNLVEGTDQLQQRRPTDMFDTVKFHGHERRKELLRIPLRHQAHPDPSGCAISRPEQGRISVSRNPPSSFRCGVLLRLPLQHLSSLAELSACMDVAGAIFRKNASARIAVKYRMRVTST